MVTDKGMEMNDLYLLAGSEDLSREFNDLASFYSDYHKDVYGFRPRHLALIASAYETREALLEAKSHLERLIDGLGDYMKSMESTFEGRESLREDGWYIEETDPQYIEAAALSAARRKAERARMEYECSWEYHVELQEAEFAAKAEKAEDDLHSHYYNKYEVA